MSTTNYTSLGYAEETVPGTMDTSAAFQKLPTTGGSPVANISTSVSEVIRDDRQTDDLVVTDLDVSGDVNYELSYVPYKPLITALMQNNTTGSIAVPAATYTDTGATLGATDIHTDVAVGDVFKLTSASQGAAVDGVYVCIDNTTPNIITFYPALPDSATADAVADLVLATTTIIDNGADTPKSYTFKKTVVDGANTFRWYYEGCRISTMSFNFATGSILTGAMGLIGQSEDTYTNAVKDTDTDLPVQAYSIMNSVSSVGTVYIDGVTLGTCSFSSLDLTVDNQFQAAKSIGQLGACDVSAMSLNVSGSTEVYFKDLALYDKFKASEAISVTIILTDGDGNSMGINLPKVKFESLDTPISGKDQFLMQSGSIRSLRDITNDNMIKFSFVDA